MPEKLQDKLISNYVYKEYDISYPIIITRWEIMQVKGLDKRYLQVYFQKISDTAKAFTFNAKCYSDFGEVENLSDISLQDVDKNSLEFSKVVPLKAEVNRVDINIQQCLLLDNSMVEPKGKQIVVNTFKPFNEEDSEAGKRLLPNAKGLPIDNVSHWYCACGALHSSDAQRCENCNKSKKEIFDLFTFQSIDDEKKQIEKNKSKIKTKKLVLACITLGVLILTLIAFSFYVLVDGHNRIYGIWIVLNKTLFILLILTSLGLVIVNVLGWFLFKDRLFKRIQYATIITCLAINLINSVIGFTIGYDFAAFYAPLIMNIPCTVIYFVCNNEKLFDKIYNLFKVKKYKN